MARDIVVVNTTGTESNARLAYAPGSEHHFLTMSNLGGHGIQLEIVLVVYITIECLVNLS